MWEDKGAVHVKKAFLDMLKSEESNVVKQLVWRISANLYMLYMLLLFLDFKQVPRSSL